MRKRYFYTPLPDYVVATKTTVQSIANAAIVKLTGLVHISGDGMVYNPVLDNVRLSKAGVYLVIGCIDFAANGVGQRGVYIGFNGATNFINSRTIANNTAAAIHRIQVEEIDVYQGAQGDALLDIRAYQSSGAALNVNSAQLSIIKLLDL